MHGGLHRTKRASALVTQHDAFRTSLVAHEPADLSDIAHTAQQTLSLNAPAMVSRALRAAFDATADAPPPPELHGALALEVMRTPPG